MKNPPDNSGDPRDTDWIPGSGGFPGVGNSKPLQYSCLEHSMEGGIWQARVHGTAESDMNEHARMHTLSLLDTLFKLLENC